jgi:hypothetical protein
MATLHSYLLVSRHTVLPQPQRHLEHRRAEIAIHTIYGLSSYPLSPPVNLQAELGFVWTDFSYMGNDIIQGQSIMKGERVMPTNTGVTVPYGQS